MYKVSLISHFHPECHPYYDVPPDQFPYFTRPIVVTHPPGRVMTTCNMMNDVILRVVKYIDHMPAEIIGNLFNITRNVPRLYAIPSADTVLSYRRKKRVMFFSATPSNSYASLVSKLVSY